MPTQVKVGHQSSSSTSRASTSSYSSSWPLTLHEGMNIKLAVCSDTSWLTDGPAGYAEALQVIYDWSQSYTFKMNQHERNNRSLIVSVLFPQPMLPYIKLNESENQFRQHLNQHSFEATNLARMMIGANCHRMVRSGQSETDLVGMETLHRGVHDKLFNAVPFSFKAQLNTFFAVGCCPATWLLSC